MNKKSRISRAITNSSTSGAALRSMVHQPTLPSLRGQKIHTLHCRPDLSTCLTSVPLRLSVNPTLSLSLSLPPLQLLRH